MEEKVNLLPLDSIEMDVRADTWQEAVRAAGNILVRHHQAAPSYVDSMVNLATELGPYIVMTPGVAIPHARPEEGALQVGFAAVKLATPINFGNKNNDPVHLVLAFCTPNADAHIEMLSKIAEALGQDNLVEKIQAAKTPQQLADLFIVAE
ncbi:MAG: PTS sugar transporter subunit IIA [Anaerolineaceae bacterium]